MSKSADEREHIMRWDDGTDQATLYTHKRTLAERLIAKGAKVHRVAKIEGRVVSWTLHFPKTWLRMPTGNKRAKRIMTPEQRVRLAETLAKSRNVVK